MLGRIVRPGDFQRVLGRPPRARSAHFAIHHLHAVPERPAFRVKQAELSTDSGQACEQAVDESGKTPVATPPAPRDPLPEPEPAPGQAWLGMVVPKRHARRSVTRSLVKRQIRATFAAVGCPIDGGALPPGLWVVRLRAPIDRARFPSAASEALRELMRSELQGVWHQAVRRGRGG